VPSNAGYEITTNDPTAARTFYEGLFGWTEQGDPDVYLMLPPAAGGIPAGSCQPAARRPTQCFGFEVDDVDYQPPTGDRARRRQRQPPQSARLVRWSRW
jgi:predicted enzyme related to lactoylglutathione lyase